MSSRRPYSSTALNFLEITAVTRVASPTSSRNASRSPSYCSRIRSLYFWYHSVPGYVIAETVEVLVGKTDHLVRDGTDAGVQRPAERALVRLRRGALADRLHHPRREAFIAVHEVRAARLFDRPEHFGA